MNIAIEELRLRSIKRSWFIPILLSEWQVPDLEIRPGEYLPDIQWVPLYKDFSIGLKRITDVILPLHNEATVKSLLNNAKSNGDEIVTLVLEILSKMPEFSDPQVFEELLLAPTI